MGKERDAINEFYNLQTCSERRIKKIKLIIENSRKVIGKDLTKLKVTDVSSYLREINNSKYTEWTKNDYRKIFKSFLKWQYKSDLLEWMENPSVKDGFRCVSQNKAFNKKRINKNTLITSEELEKLLRTASSLKWKALLTLLYESAFRPCEIVNLTFSDLKFIDSKNICSVTTISPKTGDKRDVPVQDCIVHLKRWRDEYEFSGRNDKDYVFPNPRDRTKHLSEAGIGVNISRIAKKAGIERSIFPYMFRHTRIYFIQKKLGARIASKYAGHSLETSEIYDHLDSDDVEEAMLEKVYVTEELSPEKKHELELELEKQKKKQDVMLQVLSQFVTDDKKIVGPNGEKLSSKDLLEMMKNS